ncbi:MAG TPA: hypothetical protein VKT72_15220 [Candidatus Baltobacteraceae bacterium]|nr:hypothetical protein [Candidatus Baltobacteraceae bacterium]
MMSWKRSFCALAIGLLLSSCSSAGTNTNIAPITTSNTNATMQLAVGTLYDSFGLLGTPGTYLNAVTTFRNPTGTAAFFHPGSATLSGPGGISLTLGSLFAYGQGAGVNATLGEPPAFSPQNLVGGYSTGYILTGASPAAGQYTVSTSVSYTPSSGPTTTKIFSASVTLPSSPTVLPAMPLPTWTTDGKGGGTFSMTNPPGVTEALIFIQAQNGAYVASMELKSPATSVNVPDGTLAGGTTYYVFDLGADYPMIESAPPNSTVPKPALAGAAGTADLSTSNATTFTE